MISMFKSVWLCIVASSSLSLATTLSHVDDQPPWAQYAPFAPAAEYKDVPRQCTITQVNLLERHGARFPTSGASKDILQGLAKIQRVQNWTDHRMKFIPSYVYDLGTDDLVAFGAKQSHESGQLHYERYKHLVSWDKLPFVRASSSERVVLSATNWTSGFAESRPHFRPVLSVILNEAANDTLDDHMCPNAGDSSSQETIWQSTFAPSVRERLNALAKQDLNLTDENVPSLISLCAFDSVAKEILSDWCGVFTKDELDSFDYSGDLDKYYGTGYGQDLGPVQGVGYTNELLARLTHSAVNDSTQTNHTLDSSPDTFPLDRAIYADFSHDNEMIAIYAAMGLFRLENDLDPKSKEGNQKWITRKMVPFSGRMVVEKMQCGFHNVHTKQKNKEYVRVLVNDKVMDLEFCEGVRKDGICELSQFVASQEYARSGGAGDWPRCFT